VSELQLARPSRGATGLLRVIHVVAGVGIADGGPSYTVPRLCRALSEAGVRTTLLSVAASAGPRPDTRNRDDDHRSFAWDYAAIPVLRDLRASSALSSELTEEAASSDVIHNHGLWLMPNVYAGWAASRARTPLIVAPRGMLGSSALGFSRMKKVLFWHLLQGPAIRCAVCYHATSSQEYEDIRAYGLTQPVAIIPNGIDVPRPRSIPRGTGAADRVVLSLGRIHPKKGLDRLVRAWAKVEATHPGWRLRIVGPAELAHDV